MEGLKLIIPFILPFFNMTFSSPPSPSLSPSSSPPVSPSTTLLFLQILEPLATKLERGLCALYFLNPLEKLFSGFFDEARISSELAVTHSTSSEITGQKREGGEGDGKVEGEGGEREDEEEDLRSVQEKEKESEIEVAEELVSHSFSKLIIHKLGIKIYFHTFLPFIISAVRHPSDRISQSASRTIFMLLCEPINPILFSRQIIMRLLKQLTKLSGNSYLGLLIKIGK